MDANYEEVDPRRDDFVITILPKEPNENQLPEVGTYKLESIPKWVCAVNNEAYSPRYISIGPIHRPKDGKDPLRCTALKNDYLRRLMQLEEHDEHGLRPLDKDACLKDLAVAAKETRSFYKQDFTETINGEDWAEMLLLDGCFVVMYLLEFNDLVKKTSTHTNWVWAALKIDLILLENQLPFSVLVCIMRRVLPKEMEEEASDFLTQLVVDHWVYRVSGNGQDFHRVTELLRNEEFKKVIHLVHLIHLAHYRMIYGIYGDEINKDSGCDIVCSLISLCMWKTRSGICYLPILAMMLLSWPFRLVCQFADPEEQKEEWRKMKKKEVEVDEDGTDEDEEVVDDEKNIPSATEVHNLGISFRKKHRRLGPKSKYDVRINALDNNTLDIPQLVVSNSEEPLLHNLIAWEHAAPNYAKYDEEGHFTKYAFLMYNLINKSDDIALLQREGILLNKLGTDDEVVTYFKELVQWNSRDPKITTRSTSFETCLQKVKNFFLCKKDERSKIDQVMEVLKRRVEQPEYRYWAEVKKYFSSPLQVLLVLTSFVVFLSTLLPAILSVHTTK